MTLLFPSMGRLTSEGDGGDVSGQGLPDLLPPPRRRGRAETGPANTSGKECLPLILTTGALLNYIQTEKRTDEVLVYFMPTGSGPCRFGQYQIFMQDLCSA